MNANAPLRTELVRAYQRFFGSKGGFTPSAFNQVMPVVVMDSEAWPGARRWWTSEASPAVAASNSVVIIENTDPLDSNSLVVIDWWQIKSGATADIIMGIVPSSTFPYLLGPFATPDMAPNAVAGSSSTSLVSNVTHGTMNQAGIGAIGARLFSIGTHDKLANMPDFAVPPQSKFIIANALVNTILTVTISGRYYSGL